MSDLCWAWGIAYVRLPLYLRIPAGFTMAIVGFAGLAYATSLTAAFGLIGAEMWNIFSGYGLTVIPMFILVGEFVHYAGYNDSLYHATHKWFGHYRGGLAITTILASAAFSAISGSNTATAATMSSVAIPAMKKYRYHPVLNAGSVAAGATLGVLIPPSIVLVVYGTKRASRSEGLLRQRDPRVVVHGPDRRHGVLSAAAHPTGVRRVGSAAPG
jgi:TRAP-type mannitol/chloroaromatic compound transport system permease large subunit